MASDGDWFWPLAGAALLAWFAYDKWWREEAPPKPPIPIYEAYPEGPIAELDDGSVWRMAWGSVKGPRTARLAWVRADHSKNKKLIPRETLTLYQINCETTGYRTLNIVDYDKDGNVLNKWGEDTFGKGFDYGPPGSNISYVIHAACLPRFDTKGPTAIPPPVSIK